MTDERTTEWAINTLRGGPSDHDEELDAAEQIVRAALIELQTRVERLEAALTHIADGSWGYAAQHVDYDVAKFARAALSEQPDKAASILDDLPEDMSMYVEQPDPSAGWEPQEGC